MANADAAMDAGVQKATNAMEKTKDNLNSAYNKVGEKYNDNMKVASDKMDQAMIDAEKQRHIAGEAIDGKMKDTNEYLNEKLKNTGEYIDKKREQLAKVSFPLILFWSFLIF